jgi:hypothetical protein
MKKRLKASIKCLVLTSVLLCLGNRAIARFTYSVAPGATCVAGRIVITITDDGTDYGYPLWNEPSITIGDFEDGPEITNNGGGNWTAKFKFPSDIGAGERYVNVSIPGSQNDPNDEGVHSVYLHDNPTFTGTWTANTEDPDALLELDLVSNGITNVLYGMSEPAEGATFSAQATIEVDAGNAACCTNWHAFIVQNVLVDSVLYFYSSGVYADVPNVTPPYRDDFGEGAGPQAFSDCDSSVALSLTDYPMNSAYKYLNFNQNDVLGYFNDYVEFVAFYGVYRDDVSDGEIGNDEATGSDSFEILGYVHWCVEHVLEPVGLDYVMTVHTAQVLDSGEGPGDFTYCNTPNTGHSFISN